MERNVARPGAAGATICRLSEPDTRWRVRVETWRAGDACQGRFIFEPEPPVGRDGRRSGPIALRGRTAEEVVAAAHDVPERRLREMLHSLA